MSDTALTFILGFITAVGAIYVLCIFPYLSFAPRRDHGALCGKPRDSRWAQLARDMKAERPACECCGEPTEAIHHVIPFHTTDGAKLELERSNLIAVCNACHWRVCHGCNWRAWLPDCRRLAGTIRSAILARSE